MQMLAAGGIGGIEILIGATALLSVVAIIAFFVGDSRESSASEGTTSVAEAVVEAAIEGDPEAEIDPPSETETDPAAEPVMAKLVDDEPKGKPTSVLSDLPKLDASKGKPKPSVLPSLPVISANVDDADPIMKRTDEPKELPVFPMPPVPKPTASDLPKPFLDDRPESGDSALVPELPTKPEKEKKKPTLPGIPIPPVDMPALPPLPAEASDPPPLPKRGSDLPPLPDIPTLEDEADLQTREQERDV